jgi:acetyl esterase/lipase
MDESLILERAPPLNQAWLQHEKEAGLLGPQPVFRSIEERQPVYAKACRDRNAQMLAGRDKYLAEGIIVVDSTVEASDGHPIRIRRYTVESGIPNYSLVIYYHGGGLRVGDLDSEDISCRRICKETGVAVISIEYRLMPQNPPEKCLQDAYDAFNKICAASAVVEHIYLVGSSSGGQLAAQVSQLALRGGQTPIRGVLLRCPLTVNAAEGGIHIPQRFRALHTSYTPSFETSLLRVDENAARVNTSNLPLEAESFAGLPRTFIQVCTNDIYYSDGVCYAEALRQARGEVKIGVVWGWPHTFWLKAPQLERALEAEKEMIDGLRWLMDG